MHPAVRTFISVSILAAAVASPVLAQNDADMREIAAYKLTLPAIQKFQKAMGYIRDEAMKDPHYKKQLTLKADIKALEKKEERTEAEDTKLESMREELQQLEEKDDRGAKAETLADMAALADKMPIVANALRKAGLSSREYAVFSFALFSAVAYEGMQRQGMIKTLPKEANAANVAFVRDHQAEIKALTDELKKVNGEDK